MNFFGHATVASMQGDEPRFLLGAMLPDFSSMTMTRFEAVLDEALARGVELHHETDRLFHAAPAFRAACASALAELEPRAVTRATARAVGHVGSELLLDGLLSVDARARSAYADALRVALDERVERSITWKSEGDAERLRALFVRLRAAPLPEGYRDLDFVCDRLARILAPRPRLAMQPADHAPVRTWLAGAARHLERECDAIMELMTRGGTLV
jgi:acyl carrier protein phosphodiesterase